MRNRNFIAEHRGGLLRREDHVKLIKWACQCAGHVLLIYDVPEKRLTQILSVAIKWSEGEVRTGEAMKAAVEAHAIARSLIDPVLKAVARSIGHAVATAHMADHSLGAALYALRAVKSAGHDVESERNWQNNILPPEIRDIVMNTRIIKEKAFRLI